MLYIFELSCLINILKYYVSNILNIVAIAAVMVEDHATIRVAKEVVAIMEEDQATRATNKDQVATTMATVVKDQAAVATTLAGIVGKD